MSEKKDFPALLKEYEGEIKKALPAHIDPERMKRMCMTSFHKNPKLKECAPVSVMASVIQSAQLGLELESMGESYLVPYYDKRKGLVCQFIPGWRGLVKLALNAGKVTVWTGCVHREDHFEYMFGGNPFLNHKPSDVYDDMPMTYFYAVGRIKGSDYPIIEVWSLARVEKHLNRYNKVGDRHYAYNNFEMYARKVVLLQILKYVPLSSELTKAIVLNDQAEIGEQQLNIDGSYEEVPPTSQHTPRSEKEIPVLSDEDFQKKVPMWRKAVQDGQEPGDLIKIIENRDMLTEEQHLTIHSWKAEAE